LHIKINQQSWHTKLFLFSTSVWSQFRHEDERLFWQNNSQTNLCFYLRVILVWLPLVALAHAAFLMLALFALVALPIQLYGVTPYVKVTGTLAGALLCFYFADKFVAKELELTMSMRTSDNETDSPRKKDQTPSFAKLIMMRIKAAKDKVCPIIVIGGEQS
jgi:hypothetical protein